MASWMLGADHLQSGGVGVVVAVVVVVVVIMGRDLP